MMDTVQSLYCKAYCIQFTICYYFSITITVKKAAMIYRYHIFESKSVTYSNFFLKCTTCTKFIQHLDNHASIHYSVNHNTTENYYHLLHTRLPEVDSEHTRTGLCSYTDTIQLATHSKIPFIYYAYHQKQ